MKSLWKNPIFHENALVLALLLALVHLFYWRTAQAGFVTDFTGFMLRLDGAIFSDVWNCFGFPAMHQVTNILLYTLVKCFGTNGLPWYLVFTSLHVANCFLGFVFSKKLFAIGGQERSFLSALMASLLFLVSPYQAEVVVWRVCINFLFCSLAMLSSLLFLMKYLEGKNKRHLFCSHGLFVVALFTFELSVALPLLSGVLLFMPFDNKIGGDDIWGKIKGNFLPILFPQLMLLMGYFLLNKLVLGGWTGHYGEAVHLNFDLRLIAANCLKYFTKYLLFWREWPHGGKEWLMLFFERKTVAWSGLVLGLFTLFALFFYKKNLPKWRLAGISALLFFLALAPVSNLYVAYVLNGENDRYGYLPSLFFFIGLVAFLNHFPGWLRNIAFCSWLLASIFFLQKMCFYWQQSAEMVNGLLHDFRWQDAPEVYVLAFPENFHGVPMFKDFSRQDLTLRHSLYYLANKPIAGNIHQISQFNLTSINDRFTTSRDSTGVFKLQFKQWGNWWWLYGMGLGDYQMTEYRFRTEGNGCRVELKTAPKEGAVFIVAQGAKWEEL